MMAQGAHPAGMDLNLPEPWPPQIPWGWLLGTEAGSPIYSPWDSAQGESPLLERLSLSQHYPSPHGIMELWDHGLQVPMLRVDVEGLSQATEPLCGFRDCHRLNLPIRAWRLQLCSRASLQGPIWVHRDEEQTIKPRIDELAINPRWEQLVSFRKIMLRIFPNLFSASQAQELRPLPISVHVPQNFPKVSLNSREAAEDKLVWSYINPRQPKMVRSVSLQAHKAPNTVRSYFHQHFSGDLTPLSSAQAAA